MRLAKGMTRKNALAGLWWGGGKGVVVTSIPARPFLRPAFDKFSKGARKRFLGRVSRLLKMGGL